MKRTRMRLADGRELIFFDEAGGVTRERRDLRDLPPLAVSSELRYDVLLDEWVVIAAHRQGRSMLPPPEHCPLCPSVNGRQSEVPAPTYDVVVFENRFPSLAMESGLMDSAAGDADEQLFEQASGSGRCEVVCFAPDHNATFSSLSPERVRMVMDVWVDRTVELSKSPGIAQVFCFENRGEEIGVTLHHPHGQIYGYPFITPRTRQMMESSRAYTQRTSRNLFDDLLAAELRAGVRIVAETEHWVAFVPFAARWPIEVHLYPRRRVADLPALSEAERNDFAALYLQMLGALDNYFDVPMPYISAWHQAPVSEGHEYAALHLQLFSTRRAPSKLKYLASSESAMGVWINDVIPDGVAARLRDMMASGRYG